MRLFTLTLLLPACAEPMWTDERIYLAMKAAAGPSAIARSLVPMLQDCVDHGELDTIERVTVCEVDHEDGEVSILTGKMQWESVTEEGKVFLDAGFTETVFGGAEHSGSLNGELRYPNSPGEQLEFRDLALTLDGDPFEHWTENENEFLVAVAPLALTYASWSGDAPTGSAWSSGSGEVEINGGETLKLAVWTQPGGACFDSLPMARFEIEEGELDVTIEPSDWEACDACWTWRNDAGETGEMCRNDVL